MSKFRIITSTKAEGNMSANFGDKTEVENHRANFCKSHNIDVVDIAFVEPCHTGSLALVYREDDNFTNNEDIKNKNATKFGLEPFMKVPVIDADFPGYMDAIDGLMTVDPTISIALLSGDCVPLIITDEETGLHGILHVGLLGLLNDMTGTLSDALIAMLIPIWRVKFHFGPHISSRHYDLLKSGMWERVGKQASEKCPWINDFIEYRGNGVDKGAFLDLGKALESRLIFIGAVKENITFDKRSTAEDNSEFFSHFKARRQGITNGRFMTIISR